MTHASFTEEMLAKETIAAEINGHAVSAMVQPGCGGNLVSLRVNGDEYLHYDPVRLLDAEPMYTGCFIMFPTPCRIPDGEYAFQGRSITQNKRGERITIHGLVRDETFTVHRTDASVTMTLAITPDHPVYEGFPFEGRLTVHLAIIERGLAYTFQYYNTGKTDAPFGFGLHPFWRIPGKREDVAVRVPRDQTMLLDANLIPTGETQHVEGTAYDLRRSRSLAGVELDNVWIGATKEPACIAFRDRQRRLTLVADDIFTHQIVYAPTGAPFVCVENLTCAPNAVNMTDADPAVSGLRVVPAGGVISGTTRFVVQPLDA